MYVARNAVDTDSLHEVMKDWVDYTFGPGAEMEYSSLWIWTVRTPKETLAVRCVPNPKSEGFMIEVLGGASNEHVANSNPFGE